MSPLNDGQTSSRPSLLGSGHSSTTDTLASNRVLAQLEGRQASSPTAKTLGAGLVAALLVGAGGLYAWQSRTPANGAPPPTAPAMAAAPAPVPQQVAKAAPDSEPAPQPARIVQGGDTTAADSNADSGTSRPTGLEPASPAPQPPHAATPAPAPSARLASAQRVAPDTPGATRPQTADRAKTKNSQAKGAHAGDNAKTPAKRATASNRKTQPPQAVPDSDAELLAALLRRRVPQPDHPSK